MYLFVTVTESAQYNSRPWSSHPWAPGDAPNWAPSSTRSKTGRPAT